jgi:putative ABC transport system permease protein
MSFWQDVGYAFRTLRRAPGFTAVSVVVLAVGIGANAAMFGLVDAALLRPLPFASPERLVMVSEAASSNPRSRVAPLNFLDWNEQNRTFESLAAIAGGARTLTGTSGAAERIPGQAVTSSFFELLGTPPIAGRTFGPGDTAIFPSIVVIGEQLWRSRFGGDLTLIGQPITLDGLPFTVIGIMPRHFQVLAASDLWTPLVPIRSPEQRRTRYLQVLGRLNTTIGVSQAQADMALIAQDIARLAPDTNTGWTIRVEPLRQAIVGDELRVTSWILAGVVAFLLLMTCSNIANLLLARGLGRTREMALRAALGASRGRIVRQLLTESALLAMFGGVAGLVVTWGALEIAPVVIPAGILPASVVLAFDERVMAFAFAASLTTGVLFGLAPAWQASGISLAKAMATGGRTPTRGHEVFRKALATGEIAIAILLIVEAGLLLRTLLSLNGVDSGYRAENVLTMYTALPFSRYSQAQALGFYQSVEREIAAIPGVRVVSVGGNLPLDGWDYGTSFEITDDDSISRANRPAARYQIVGSEYFRTLGIPILHGRGFTPFDTAASQQVCIVNEEFVARHFKGESPVGRQITVQSISLRGPQPVLREIVGVVKQIKGAASERENAIEIYVPVTQNPWYTASIVVQTIGHPTSYVGAVREALDRVDQNQPVTRVRTMEEVASESTARPRFRAQLVGTFAALALLLASVGVFGLLAFTVGQRTREFGIRMALGGSARDVLRLVLVSCLRITMAGITIGTVAAAMLSRFLSTLLFGVTPLDPVTFISGPVILTAVALLACSLPAWRAIHIEPATALRHD